MLFIIDLRFTFHSDLIRERWIVNMKEKRVHCGKHMIPFRVSSRQARRVKLRRRK